MTVDHSPGQKDQRPTDLRAYSRQTSVRLGIGALLVLFIIGDGLIYLIYGQGAAITGVLCILGGLVPILLIIVIFSIMDWIVKRANRE